MATTFIQDSFTEASDTALASHTPEVGGSWAAHPSSAATATVVASEDRVQGSSTSVTAVYLNSTAPASRNYEVQIVARIATAASARCGVVARYSSAADTGYRVYYSGTQWELARYNAGVSTVLGAYNGSEALNTDYAVRLVLYEDRLAVYVAGTLVIDVIDIDPILSVGQAGLSVRLNGRVDDFYAITLDPATPRLYQGAAEVLSQGAPAPRLYQSAVEVLSTNVVSARLYQSAVEVLSLIIAPPRLYQTAVEVLVRETSLIGDIAAGVNGLADLQQGTPVDGEAAAAITGVANLEVGSMLAAEPAGLSATAEGRVQATASFDDEIEIAFNATADVNTGTEIRPTTDELSVTLRGNLRVGAPTANVGNFFMMF